MILYDVKTAPSPRRVRIFLAEKNLDVEVIQVNTAEGEHLKEDFLKLNPWATVPVLKLDDGTCISEAIACCRYLEENYPNPPLMGVDPSEKAIISMWEHRMEWDGFLPVAEVLRNTDPGITKVGDRTRCPGALSGVVVRRAGAAGRRDRASRSAPWRDARRVVFWSVVRLARREEGATRRVVTDEQRSPDG